MNNVNVTVLRDEKLGGIEREYTEVKRLACVGERIKIVNAWMTYGTYDNGAVFTVDRVSGGSVYVNLAKFPGGNSGGYISKREYVVLDPTEIVRIGGERFRMVDRKAAVGERIIIVATADRRWKNGAVFTVRESEPSGVWIKHPEGNIGGKAGVFHREYRVLEPLASAAAPPSTSGPADLTEVVANLARRVAELERLIAPSQVARGTVPNRRPSFLKPTRDEIVQRAKDDVAALETTYQSAWSSGGASFWPQACAKQGYSPVHYVEYVINREKRTVVALIRRLRDKSVYYKGIAKCAPDDVFNAHIGRAISLRRALGLEVPAEYTSAPQPTEPRVGDIIRNGLGKRRVVYAVRPKMRTYGVGAGEAFVSADKGLTYVDDSNYEFWTHIQFVTIIDDSREETEVSA
ncbi:hypothetical protein [Paenibacillus sp. P22]|uniref:hypothetical protein n=1 Tax=Paenibacillus sp. P22 TaxID=483908 RepID=UPI0003903A7A|nr:hypothetical protein [Paenibacillus sp. P22]CDN42054.1 Uncharacterized protein BN871_AT_00560 [Paenibacillus sp. P22]